MIAGRKTPFLLLFCFFSLISVQVFAQLPEDDYDDELNAATTQTDISPSDSALEKIIKPVDIPFVKGKPRIDGKIDEEYWQRAVRLSVDFELFPSQFATPPVQTDAYIARGEDALYVAFYAHDEIPGKIQSHFRPKDAAKSDDFVGIALDTIGNRSRIYEFRVNPHGSQIDYIYGAVGDTYHYDWDTQWEADGQINDDGYSVEMAIPFQGLDIVNPEDGGNWFMALRRQYPRAIRHSLGSIYTITTPKVTKSKKKRIELIPFVVIHQKEERDLKAVNPQWQKMHSPFQPGLDGKWIIDSATKLSFTANPDYSEIELDMAKRSINNPFDILLPEKRRFFAESIDILSTHQRLIYTRNILDTRLGIKYSRQRKDSSTSFFIAGDDKTSVIIPGNLSSETLELDDRSVGGAARYRFERDNGDSHGLTLTYRQGEGYHNVVPAFDGFRNLSLADKIRYQFAVSSTRYPSHWSNLLCDGDDCNTPPPADCTPESCGYNEQVLRTQKDGTFMDYAFRLSYKHVSPKWLIIADYTDVGPDFRGDMGYIPMVDFRSFVGGLAYNMFFDTFKTDEGKSRLRYYGIVNFRHSHDGEKISDGFDFWLEYRGFLQSVLRPGYRIGERATQRTNWGDLSIDENSLYFTEKYFQWYYEIIPFRGFKINLDGRWGKRIDEENSRLGDFREIIPRIEWNIGKSYEISCSHALRWMEIGGEELFKENYTTLFLSYRPNTRGSLNFIFINDLTKTDPDLYLYKTKNEEEVIRTFQLTFDYKFSEKARFISGIKIGTRDNDMIEKEGLEERDFFVKFSYVL